MPFRYTLVADELKTQIETLGLNSLLPSEADLARSFNVSRVTIRRALAVLESAGILDRQRGRGTIVNPLKVERSLMPTLPIERDLLRQGIAIKTELLSVERGVSPVDRSLKRLKSASVNALSAITFLRKVGNRVVAFDRRYVSDATLDILRLDEIDATPIGELVARCAAVPVTAHKMELEFLPASVDVSKFLGINPGTLVVRSIGADLLGNGEPHCVTEMYYRIDRVKFSFLSHYAPVDVS